MKKLGAFLLGSMLAATSAYAAFDSAVKNSVTTPPEILRITPEGNDAEPGGQIVIEFNRPMVPVGEMARKSSEIPVEITPKLNCEWRWLNTSALSCNLKDEDFTKNATSYKVTVRPGIKAEDGTTTAADYVHNFTTHLPDVSYAYFDLWESEGKPVMRVMFNQPVTKDSVEKSMYFESGGKQFEVDVAAYDAKEKLYEENGKKGLSYWIVKASSQLPAASETLLKVRPGLVSINGTEKGNSDREIFRFATHGEFAFLGIKCTTNNNIGVIAAPGEQVADLCNPLGGTTLRFSAPVSGRHIRETVQVLDEKGRNIWPKETAEEEGEDERYMLRRSHITGTEYEVWLPMLKAATTYNVVIRNPEYNFFERVWRWVKSIFAKQPDTAVHDLFERPLMQAAKMTFKTDHRLPNFVIANNPAVLEAGIDSEVPLYVQNIDSAVFTYNSNGAKGLTYKYNIPNVKDIQFAIPFDIRKMLRGKSGAVFGKLSTTPNVTGGDELFAEVTPYQVHAKIGHFNSFIWVTEFATGKVVENAKVSIYTDSLQSLNGGAFHASAVTDAGGVATLAGLDSLDPELGKINNWDVKQDSMFIKVEKNGEVAILPLMGDFEVYSYGSEDYSAYPITQKKYGHIKTWGTTAQGIYHAGDTIQYKIYVRNQDAKTLVPAPRGNYKLQITDPTGNVVNTVENIQLNEFGSFSGEFATNANAPVGWYSFMLSSDLTSDQWYPVRVLVSDFTPAPFKVTNQLNGTMFKNGDDIKVTSFAKLHSGGPYTDANVRVSAILTQDYFAPENPLLKNYIFNSYVEGQGEQQVFEKQDKLNDKGEFETSFRIEDAKVYYGNLMVESAVQDDRGKSYASSSSVNFAGVDRFVGLKMDGWVFDAGKPAAIKYAVVDAAGNLQEETVEIVVEKETITAAKVKGAGNAYSSDYNVTWEKAGSCKEETEKAENTCKVTPKTSGYYRVTGMVKDTKGNPHKSETYFYVSGSDYVMWSDPNDTSLSIVPEKSGYKVGDVAKFLVKNPYPGAVALVTVERYGVIDHFTQVLSDSAAIIEIPVKPDYMPGFYMSVTVFSGRVDKPVKDQVDLGKPAFRTGYATVPVNDLYKQMDITAVTDKSEYRPGEIVTLDLKAAPKVAGKKEPIEFAVAVLDESVLDMVAGGKAYYDPYKGLYTLDSLDVKNFSLLTRLVGRQKFEKKGANPGGDGGANLSMRDVFKYVSYWNPSIKADADGEASVDFKLPDNLTGWRVLAIATTPSDRVGLGDYNFKTNKKTEVRAAMPNQVTEGDSFDAAFTVMNRTDKAREIEVKIVTDKTLLTKKVKVEPYKRELVKVPVTTGRAGEMVFKVYAADKIDNDSVTHKLNIGKRRSLETAATYGTTEQGSVSESIQIPKNIFPDVGAVSVITSPTVIGNVDGAFEYMRDYPYICWEQKMSKAVMAAHYTSLNDYLSIAWGSAANLPQATLDMAKSYQAPNGGMAYYTPEDGRADPYLSAYTALSFNWLKAAGYKVPKDVEDKLHAYLQNMLSNNILPDYYSDGMTSSVRAVALNALAANGKASIADLERYRAHFKNMDLFGKTNFLQASMNVNGADSIAEESVKNILSYANQSGGKFNFNEQVDETYGRLLYSELRTDCAILSALTRYGEGANGQLVADIPFKLTRMITQARGTKRYWENTQENMFCMNALVDYARVYEKETPDMNVTVKQDNALLGTAKFTALTDKPVALEKNLTAADIGKKSKVEITREGSGRLYYTTRVSYANKDDNAKAKNSGIEIRREYSVQRGKKFEKLTLPAEIKQGDLIKVDIYVKLPGTREYVVVDDPIPGGLEPVNRDLANTSSLDADAANGEGDWMGYGGYYSFYFKELRNDRAVFYSEYLAAGGYHLSYTAQAIASGKFSVMPVKAEEMYEPDVYGLGTGGTLTILPK